MAKLEFAISKSLTKKLLWLGCEKLYLKLIAIPFSLIILALIFTQNLNMGNIFVVGGNLAIFILIGQFIANKNPYMFEIMLRHLSYQKAYYAQRKYGRQKINLLSRDLKGHRTYRSISRNN